MNVPKDLKYTNEHEWAKVEDSTVTVGISDYAQAELGDVVFVELPEVGSEVSAKDSVATIESVKAVSDIYTPVSGVVLEVNEALSDSSDLVNNEPYESGWIFKIKASDASELEQLLDAGKYQELLTEIAK